MIFKIKETAPNTKVIILSDSPNSQGYFFHWCWCKCLLSE